MDLSIIIVSYNTKELLKNCLGSVLKSHDLRAAHPSLLAEIIVVDNASTDDSAKMIEEEFSQVRLIKNSRNLGFAQANNQGIKQSKGKYLLLLNPDTLVIQPNTFSSMIQFIEVNPKVGVLGPRLLNSDRSLQYSARYFPNLLTHFLEINGWISHLKKLNSRVGPVDWVSGAAMLVRRLTIEEVGLFDEDYFMFGEEMDWQHRIQKKGWQIWYDPEVSIVHLGGRSVEKISDQALLWQFQNLERFTQKHYNFVKHNLLRLTTYLGLELIILRSRDEQKEAYRSLSRNLFQGSKV